MAARLAELTIAPVIRRRRRLPVSLVVGGTLVLALIVIAALAQWIAPYPYDQMHVRDRFLAPNFHYLAGTDEYGRDVFSRLLIGSQLSLALGVTATLISMGIGVPLGLIAGYRRGVTDELIMRTLDVMLAFPPIMLVLLILAVTPPSLLKTSIAIGVLAVAPIARVTRSVTLDLMSGEFILERPAHPYSKGLLASRPPLAAASRDSRLAAIAGQMPTTAAPDAGCVFAPRCPFHEPRCSAGPQPMTITDDGHRVRCWKADALGSWPRQRIAAAVVPASAAATRW